jgi:hypothetical protein
MSKMPAYRATTGAHSRYLATVSRLHVGERTTSPGPCKTRRRTNLRRIRPVVEVSRLRLSLAKRTKAEV